MMWEDFRLRIFVKVAETGSFTKAAEELGISQPAVSQQIIALEKQLAARLFSRGRGEAFLTAEGRAFLGYAEKILYWYSAAAAQFGEKGRPGQHRPVRLAADPVAASYLLPPVLSLLTAGPESPAFELLTLPDPAFFADAPGAERGRTPERTTGGPALSERASERTSERDEKASGVGFAAWAGDVPAREAKGTEASGGGFAARAEDVPAKEAKGTGTPVSESFPAGVAAPDVILSVAPSSGKLDFDTENQRIGIIEAAAVTGLRYRPQTGIIALEGEGRWKAGIIVSEEMGHQRTSINTPGGEGLRKAGIIAPEGEGRPIRPPYSVIGGVRVAGSLAVWSRYRQFLTPDLAGRVSLCASSIEAVKSVLRDSPSTVGLVPLCAVAEELEAGTLLALLASLPGWTLDVCFRSRPEFGRTAICRRLRQALSDFLRKA